MIKYDLLRQQLLREGHLTDSDFFKPKVGDLGDILAVHSPEYYRKLATLQLTKKEERATGFPLSKALIQREKEIAFGTIQCARYALEDGVSANIAGGTHHAFRDRGEGFCLLNDQAIAAVHLLNHSYARRVAILDLDVHQGNGTAMIFKNEPRVFTVSIHGRNNYPLEKPASDIDVGLEDGVQDDEYLDCLKRTIDRMHQKFDPDFVFYQSGVDVLDTDRLGRLSLSKKGCQLRDHEVMNYSKSNGIPFVMCMGGGYSPVIGDILNAHVKTFETALKTFDRY